MQPTTDTHPLAVDDVVELVTEVQRGRRPTLPAGRRGTIVCSTDEPWGMLTVEFAEDTVMLLRPGLLARVADPDDCAASGVGTPLARGAPAALRDRSSRGDPPAAPGDDPPGAARGQVDG